MSNPSRNTTKSARMVSGVLAVGLEAVSVVIGLFFMGTVSLQASDSRMSVAWSIWLALTLASAVGLIFAVRSGSLTQLIGFALAEPSTGVLAERLRVLAAESVA